MKSLAFALLWLGLIAGPAEATWSYVGGTINAGALTVTRSVTAGNLLIVAFMSGSPTDTFTISDGVNTWTTIGAKVQESTNNNTGQWWWASAATTASITVTLTAAGAAEVLVIAEYNSTAGAVPADSLEAATQKFTTPGVSTTDGDTSGNATPSSNGDLIVSWVNDDSSGGDGTSFFTAGTNFTERATASNDSVSVQSIWSIEDRVQATAAAAAGTWTCKNTDNYMAFVGFFKEAAGAGGGAATRMLLGVGK